MRFSFIILLAFTCLIPQSVLSIEAQPQTEPYEVTLTKHIANLQVYPATAQLYGLEGDAIVRVRIDREGNILFYHIVKKTNNTILDKAITATLEQADPAPAMPDNYIPTEESAEYMLPIAFRMQENMRKVREIDNTFKYLVNDAWKKDRAARSQKQ